MLAISFSLLKTPRCCQIGRGKHHSLAAAENFQQPIPGHLSPEPPPWFYPAVALVTEGDSKGSGKENGEDIRGKSQIYLPVAWATAFIRTVSPMPSSRPWYAGPSWFSTTGTHSITGHLHKQQSIEQMETVKLTYFECMLYFCVLHKIK